MADTVKVSTLLASTIYTHTGPWSPDTRSSPTLAFLEKYTKMILSGDLSDPFHTWYAPSSVFHNTDGVDYVGGEEIWEWIKKLFGPFERLGEPDESRIVRLLPQSFHIQEAPGPISKGAEVKMPSRKPDELGQNAEVGLQKADLVLYEHVMVFYLQGRKPSEEGIPVRRAMEFAIGKSESEGQGMDGLQIWRGKVWWDTSVLKKEIESKGK